jgi:hypothetical protein
VLVGYSLLASMVAWGYCVAVSIRGWLIGSRAARLGQACAERDPAKLVRRSRWMIGDQVAKVLARTAMSLLDGDSPERAYFLGHDAAMRHLQGLSSLWKVSGVLVAISCVGITVALGAMTLLLGIIAGVDALGFAAVCVGVLVVLPSAPVLLASVLLITSASVRRQRRIAYDLVVRLADPGSRRSSEMVMWGETRAA